MAQVEAFQDNRSGAGTAAKSNCAAMSRSRASCAPARPPRAISSKAASTASHGLSPTSAHSCSSTGRARARPPTPRPPVGRPASRCPPSTACRLAIKDIIETADMPTGQGSPMWEGSVTRRDSASVHALREAGVVILGKTTTTEFAASHPFHTTRNPHDPTRTPGGSSSGTAAAVGSGMVPAGLGTQVVGSILRPASFCGCVGFKPSVGALNRSGSLRPFQPELPGRDRRDAGRRLGRRESSRRAGRRRPRHGRRQRRCGFQPPLTAGAARRDRDRRLECHDRRRAPGVRFGPRAARQDRRRAAHAQRRQRHRSGRAANRRRAVADPGDQFVGGTLAAQHLRRPRRRQAQRAGARAPQDGRSHDPARVRRTAGAARYGARHLRSRRAAVRCVRDARRLRRGADRARHHRQHHHERHGIATLACPR